MQVAFAASTASLYFTTKAITLSTESPIDRWIRILWNSCATGSNANLRSDHKTSSIVIDQTFASLRLGESLFFLAPERSFSRKDAKSQRRKDICVYLV
jgi:hypothetical protein